MFVYEPHTRPVVAMVIDPHDNSKLFTCSYDGTIRCADFNKTAFDEVGCKLLYVSNFTLITMFFSTNLNLNCTFNFKHDIPV